mgnify:CR=1 FL=1
MKYSIRGELNKNSENSIVTLINQFSLWRLITNTVKTEGSEEECFSFEAWVNTPEEKDEMFQNAKLQVDIYGGWVDWHECYHDESNSPPCNIAETYRR